MSIIDDYAAINLWMQQIKADRDAAIAGNETGGKPAVVVEESKPEDWVEMWNDAQMWQQAPVFLKNPS